MNKRGGKSRRQLGWCVRFLGFRKFGLDFGRVPYEGHT